jgi:hypothetical protein
MRANHSRIRDAFRPAGAILMAVLLLAISAMIGCKKAEREALATKCDAALRLRAEELATSHPDSLLDVLGKATGTIDDAYRQKLEKAGAQLGTVDADKFAARVPVKKLGAVAALDFVSSLALAQTREPLGP